MAPDYLSKLNPEQREAAVYDNVAAPLGADSQTPRFDPTVRLRLTWRQKAPANV